ncbi:MAG: hypothetical protein CL870_03765 [Cytophagia bacterium]|jgi:gliding motility-associated lipoprotein GldH|nr:hypothetical protein [Cytophagia bacterium]|tara:strand:- start:131 stop:592 length:462 start_codon:yes stop_codon:yes gene_type:complete
MRKIILIIFISFISSSCYKDNLYTNYYSFDNQIWHMDSSIVFNFNSLESTDINLNLSISYSNDYPYQNFYTSYSLLDSSKKIIKSEMVEFQFFEKKYGYPMGTGIFKNFTVDSLITSINAINKNSDYMLLVKHSMRDKKLIGIDKIGVDFTSK